MITAVDLLRGLAVLLGWDRIEVPGATGYTDTDYAAKGKHAIEALTDTDIICVHVEATDEASHEGDIQAKIQSLEQIDRHIVAPLHAALKAQGEYRVLVTPDHPTPIRTKTQVKQDGQETYDEISAAQSGLCFPEGWQLMGHFLQ